MIIIQKLLITHIYMLIKTFHELRFSNVMLNWELQQFIFFSTVNTEATVQFTANV